MAIMLIVARHCQTKLNQQERIQGSGSDLNLTKVGKQQARFMSDKIYDLIYNHKIDVVYASPSKRAKQTALEIAPYSQMVLDERLKAYNVGTAEGKKFSELKHIKRFPIPFFYQGMENLFGYIKRTKEVLKDILLESDNKVVLVVTHEDVSAMFEKYLMKKSLLSVPKNGLQNGEFRTYHIINYNKKEIAKGDFSSLGLVKHEEEEFDTDFVQGKKI